MSGKAETSGSPLNTVLWLLVALIVAGAVYGNQYFAQASVLYRFLGLIVLAAVSIGLALRTTQGRAFLALAKEARIEIRKVVWPTRQEATQTTLIVVAVVFIAALLLWGLDSLLGWLASLVIG